MQRDFSELHWSNDCSGGVPTCEVALVVRSGKRTPARERVRREILRNDCFDRLREQLGKSFDAEMDRRVHVIEGDVSRDGMGLNDEGRALLATCHTVVHSAAAVAFRLSARTVRSKPIFSVPLVWPKPCERRVALAIW